MASIQEIQNTELEMLQWFHDICEKQGFHYTAVGGTMLGAIRHQGFIPWDDDVDIYLPMEEAFQLQKIFQSEKYFLQSPETDIESPYLMYKIRKNNTIMEDEIQTGLQVHKGVWIDIFMYTNAGKINGAKKIQLFILKVLQSYRCRYYHVLNNPKRRIFKVLVKLPKGFALKVDRMLLRLIRFFGSKKSEEVIGLENMTDIFFDRRFFEERYKYPFSGMYLWGAKDSDGYLRRVYGDDYMTPKRWGHIQDYSKVIC